MNTIGEHLEPISRNPFVYVTSYLALSKHVLPHLIPVQPSRDGTSPNTDTICHNQSRANLHVPIIPMEARIRIMGPHLHSVRQQRQQERPPRSLSRGLKPPTRQLPPTLIPLLFMILLQRPPRRHCEAPLRRRL